MTTTIYLAGGMKSSWQDKVISAFPEYSFRDPRTHHLQDEKGYTEWDLRGIRESQLVLAYMDASNPSGFGLCLEVGYAYALDREVWYVCEDEVPRQRYFGMVRACSARLFSSLDSAIYALTIRKKEELA
jgi:nucleoside 2-deoxyribosyltransferase